MRLASAHPESLLSFTGIETGLAGFGLEMLADVAKGGAWYIGLLATPGAAETFFKGREQVLIGDFIMPAATVVRNAVTPRDVAELARGYAGEGGWSGALALYGSMLREAEAIRAIAKDVPLTIPTMAIDRAGSDFTLQTLQAVHRGRVRAQAIEGVGHYIAMEAPDKLAAALLAFFGGPSFEAD
ncbi:alpha/beta hydrolase [Rhizobium sp.]|uniref:alpha/beta fold hydrolase n=1 Tax=Rhizobium sp. TaxID=391 RepID=UPI0028A0EF7B